jgi:hypothetical protein
MNLQTYELPINDKAGYFKPKDGINKFRIVSELQDYGSHFIKGEQRSHICLGAEKCKYCKAGDRPKTKYLCWIIDRADGETKLYEFGHSVFKQILALAKDNEYAFEITPSYDMSVNRSGSGLDTTYTILGARGNSELTEEEKTKVDDLESIPSIIKKRLDAEEKGTNDEIVIPEEDREIREETGEEDGAENIPY